MLTAIVVINPMQAQYSKNIAPLPTWIATAVSIILSLLWTFTMLPHTLIVQNICLVIGASLGLYIASIHWRLLITLQAIPIWLISLLFLWVGIHLLFIGKNSDLQLAEFQSIWKRAALGSIFAIGFGICVIQNRSNINWRIVALGLFAPTYIYYFKYFAALILPVFHLDIPEFLTLYFGSAEFYIPKIAYVFYCLPALALALGMLLMQIRKGSSPSSIRASLFWVAAIFLVLGVFYLENIKNGIAYTLLLLILFMLGIFKSRKYKQSRMSLGAAVFVSFVVCALVFHNLRTNESWNNLLADLEVSLAATPEEVWKNTEPYYPLNRKGVPVASTNFDRSFYFRTGLGLLGQNPLGYGLVQSSFGHLARERWLNAPIIQSHSGWLDLMLGLGLPGFLLLLISAVIAIQKVQVTDQPWSIFGTWVLGSILLLFVTTEVSQKNYLNTFVWLIVLVASLGLQKTPKSRGIETSD